MSYSHWRQRVWLPACRAAGCEGAGFHDLRRANATGMVAEGVDVKTAQRRLGHADVRMTLDIYAEGLETSERRASEALAARFLPPSWDSEPSNGPHRTRADDSGDRRNKATRSNSRDGRAMVTRTRSEGSVGRLADQETRSRGGRI